MVCPHTVSRDRKLPAAPGKYRLIPLRQLFSYNLELLHSYQLRIVVFQLLPHTISLPLIESHPLAGNDNAFNEEDMDSLVDLDYLVDLCLHHQLALAPCSNELFSNRGCRL